jgi:hypothetical protein
MDTKQIEQNVRAAQARVKSGKLKETAANAWLIVTNVTSKGLEPTEDNLYAAIVDCAKSLEWDVLPNFLKLEKQSERPATIQSANAALKPFLDATKAGEVKAAKEKADAEHLKKAKSAIASYLPIDRRGHVLYSKQAEVQKILNAYIDREFARQNVNTADVLGKVVAYITDLYSKAEREAERV